MDIKREERFVDELLDALLKRYRGEAPRPGLENRILAKVLSGELPPPPARRLGLGTRGRDGRSYPPCGCDVHFAPEAAAVERARDPSSNAPRPSTERPSSAIRIALAEAAHYACPPCTTPPGPVPNARTPFGGGETAARICLVHSAIGIKRANHSGPES